MIKKIIIKRIKDTSILNIKNCFNSYKDVYIDLERVESMERKLNTKKYTLDILITMTSHNVYNSIDFDIDSVECDDVKKYDKAVDKYFNYYVNKVDEIIDAWIKFKSNTVFEEPNKIGLLGLDLRDSENRLKLKEKFELNLAYFEGGVQRQKLVFEHLMNYCNKSDIHIDVNDIFTKRSIVVKHLLKIRNVGRKGIYGMYGVLDDIKLSEQ